MVRLAGSVAILALLFWLMPVTAFREALGRIGAAEFLAVFAGFLALHVAAAGKWWLLLDGGVAFPLALRAHLAGLGANLCLPGAIGGDAVRAGLVHRHVGDGPRLAAAAAADRMIDLLALAVLAVLGLVSAGSDGAGGGAGLALRALPLLLLALAAIWFLPRALPMLWRIAPGLPGRSIGERLSAAFADLGRRPARLAGLLVASTVIQGGLVTLSWALARAAGLDLGFAPWLFAWPLAKIIAILPVSLNGLGLREGVLAALLAPYGGAAAVVVAAGLVWQAVLFLAGGLGALIFALTRSADRVAVDLPLSEGSPR